MDKFTVEQKWNTDNGGMILAIKGQLLFYAKARYIYAGGQYTLEELRGVYKQRTFNSMDDIPNDCAMAF